MCKHLVVLTVQLVRQALLTIELSSDLAAILNLVPALFAEEASRVELEVIVKVQAGVDVLILTSRFEFLKA